MPFVANTPESLLGRSDSRDPSSTCCGITSSGRACRRSIARAAAAPVSIRRTPKLDPSDESLYCWQHKEQASLSTQSSPGPRANAHPILEARSSLDTLADRLGLVNLQQGAKEKQQGRANWEKKTTGGTQRPARKSRPKSKNKLQCCFCFSIPIDEVDEASPARRRPQPRPVQNATCASVPSVAKPRKQQQQQRMPGLDASPGKNSQMSKTSRASQTARFKDLIPDAVDTATASTLLAELSRPYADAEEAGYIYMFWLTPASKQTAPPVDAARSLLAPPSPARGSAAARSRRPSDVVSRFADPSGTNGRSRMLLKIGRAANVQRRMNQWQRQCGYDIEMLRYYPYLPGASDASATGQVPRMTPHCRRVERLIHLELAGRGLHASLAACDSCGRDHREWFQVDATREGIRAVDDVIRRWVEWDETTI